MLKLFKNWKQTSQYIWNNKMATDVRSRGATAGSTIPRPAPSLIVVSVCQCKGCDLHTHTPVSHSLTPVWKSELAEPEEQTLLLWILWILHCCYFNLYASKLFTAAPLYCSVRMNVSWFYAFVFLCNKEISTHKTKQNEMVWADSEICLYLVEFS